MADKEATIPETAEPTTGARRHVRETIEALAIALVLALIIRAFVIQAFKIPSSSMEDTLLIGDHLLVSKFAYGVQVPRPAIISVLGVKIPFFETTLKPVWGSIERGDIVVFRFPGDRFKDYIKRVVALPGDRLLIKDAVVYINGERVVEPYTVFKGPSVPGAELINNYGPFVVPEGQIFVMGDNRDRSYDSRFWGLVDISEIKGKAMILYWSRDPGSGEVRFSRFGDVIK
jgi:signal peptidase I